jgi:hypothetical protein
MKLGNRGLLCDCNNSLVESSPYCESCCKVPSVHLDPSVTIDPTSTLDYITDPSNTYIGTNKDNEIYEFQKKAYRKINNDYRNPKEFSSNKFLRSELSIDNSRPLISCDKYITVQKKPNFTDPNTLYEKEYYNKNYLLLNYDMPNNKNNIKENFSGDSTQTNNIIFVIILMIILLFVCFRK